MTKDSDQTSLQQDFLANHLVSQENNNLKKITEISGKKLLELSKSPDQLGLLEKMLMESLNSISTPYLRTWRVQTTPRGALILALKASVLPTKEKESGLLPTPTQDSASERTKKYKQGGTPLTMAVRLLPTPTVGCEEGGEQSDRVEISKTGSFLLRKKNPNAKHKTFGAKLSDAMLYLEKPKTGGKLSANFTEYLMGFPTNWTKIDQIESKDSETQSAHKYHTTSDKS